MRVKTCGTKQNKSQYLLCTNFWGGWGGGWWWKKHFGAQICVNSVCLTSFNRSGLCVFSLGNMGERGEKLIMSLQPIRSLGSSGNRKHKWPTCCRNHSLFFKHLIGGWDRNPRANYWGFPGLQKNKHFWFPGPFTTTVQSNTLNICQSNKCCRHVSNSPVRVSANESGQSLRFQVFPVTAIIKTRLRTVLTEVICFSSRIKSEKWVANNFIACIHFILSP